MQTSRASNKLLDLIVWARLCGIEWRGKVSISNGPRGRGLFTTCPIDVNDILLSVPLTRTFSFLNFEHEKTFPLKVTTMDYSLSLSWWPDLDWGTFTLITWLTSKFLLSDAYLEPYLKALPKSPVLENSKSVEAEPFTVLRSIARQSMCSNEYSEATLPILQQHSFQKAAFDNAFVWLYTMVRSRAMPLWSGQRGHQALCDTSYGKSIEGANGDICCLVPVVDMINHSSQNTNVAIGFPGEEVAKLLNEKSVSRNRDIASSEASNLPRVSPDALIVVRAIAALKVGDELLMNYNDFYGFDDEIFSAWFDTPLFH